MNKVFGIRHFFYIIISVALYLIVACVFFVFERFYSLGLPFVILVLFLTFPMYNLFLYKKTKNGFASSFVLWIIGIAILLLLTFVKNGNIESAVNIFIYFVHAIAVSHFFVYATKKDSKKDIQQFIVCNYIALNTFFSLIISIIGSIKVLFIVAIPPFAGIFVYMIIFSTLVTKQVNSAGKTICIFLFTIMFMSAINSTYHLIIPYSILSIDELLKLFVFIPIVFCTIVAVTSIITQMINKKNVRSAE